jgi:hypothetical protein
MNIDNSTAGQPGESRRNLTNHFAKDTGFGLPSRQARA